MKLIVPALILFLCHFHALACSSRPTLRLYSGYESKGQSYLQPAVRTLQTLLNSRGYSLSVDGYFGPGTEAAVKLWQARAVLVVDGIVGKNTWASLCDISTTPPSTTVAITTTSRSVCSARPTLRRNAGYTSYGLGHLQWAVLALQRLLSARGFSVTADGKFGSLTENAVKQYQLSRDLKPDGIVGKNTWAMLCRTSDRKPPSTRPPPTCPAPGFKCPNGQCKNCREVGTTVKNKMIEYQAQLKRLRSIFRVKKFYDIVKTNGTGDLKNKIFRKDCCVRIYGTSVANDVPGNILYGYIGVEVFPENVLLGAAGYVHVNKHVSLPKALKDLGVDASQLKFKWCKKGFLKYPCVERSNPDAWNSLLEKWAKKDDSKDQAAIKLGFKIARKPAGIIENSLSFEVRTNQKSLRRCC